MNVKKETTFTKVTIAAFLVLIVLGMVWNTKPVLDLIPHHVIGMPAGNNTYEEVKAKYSGK